MHVRDRYADTATPHVIEIWYELACDVALHTPVGGALTTRAYTRCNVRRVMTLPSVNADKGSA